MCDSISTKLERGREERRFIIIATLQTVRIKHSPLLAPLGEGAAGVKDQRLSPPLCSFLKGREKRNAERARATEPGSEREREKLNIETG